MRGSQNRLSSPASVKLEEFAIFFGDQREIDSALAELPQDLSIPPSISNRTRIKLIKQKFFLIFVDTIYNTNK